jgi:hypothetical protein
MDDNNKDGFLFGSMMCMMMHQSWIELEQKERQNEQRERQHKLMQSRESANTSFAVKRWQLCVWKLVPKGS